MESRKTVEELRQSISEFNDKILSAYISKYSNQPEILDTMISFNRIDLLEFLETYLSSNYYDEIVVERLVYTLMDIRLQMFFIHEIEIGQYNWRVIDKVDTFEAIRSDEFVYLTKLNIDQNLILKTRILFERIMNFIYLLEKKKLLEGKSKKGKFRKFIDDDSKWSFLVKTIEKLTAFDDVFRTPEVHKFSSLRRMFLFNEDDKAEEFCFNLISSFQNSIYPNIILILQGIDPGHKSWGAIRAKGNEKLEPFFRVPDWVEKHKNDRVIGNFDKAQKLEFVIQNKTPGDVCEYLVNIKNKNILLTHNSKYSEDGELISMANKMWITCEESEVDEVKSLVENFLFN